MKKEYFSLVEMVDRENGEQFDFTLEIGLEEIEMRFISVSEFLNDVIYLLLNYDTDKYILILEDDAKRIMVEVE
jgi:hypothetical protein